MAKRKSIIPGFSWNRALGITSAKRHPNRKHLRRRKQSGARKFERADAGLAAIF